MVAHALPKSGILNRFQLVRWPPISRRAKNEKTIDIPQKTRVLKQ
jgi:hypothetical protein